VPISLDRHKFAEKLLVESIDLSCSVGAFDAGRLVGFILTGVDGDASYNAGTGVLAEYRGRRLTRRMYEFNLPRLTKRGIRSQILEVITENHTAVKSYKNSGFQIVRELICLRGKFDREPCPGFEIKPISNFDPELVEGWWNCPPTWQNSSAAIERNLSNTKIIGTRVENALVGYLAYLPGGRVIQFGVNKDYRCRGIGSSLFLKAAEDSPDRLLSVTNIGKEDSETLSFLSNSGLSQFVEQYEMRLEL
jgi:ribosomal protein S18 acetylase RimI-like enzyme